MCSWVETTAPAFRCKTIHQTSHCKTPKTVLDRIQMSPEAFSTLLVSKMWGNQELCQTEHHLFFHEVSADEIFPPVSSKRLSPCHLLPDHTLLACYAHVADESGTGYNGGPAGQVTPQHGLHPLSLRPAWRVSQRTPDEPGSHTYVAAKLIKAAHCSVSCSRATLTLIH